MAAPQPPIFFFSAPTPASLLDAVLEGQTVEINVSADADGSADLYETTEHFRDNLLPKMTQRLPDRDKCPILVCCTESRVIDVAPKSVREGSAETLLSLAWMSMVLKRRGNSWATSSEFLSLGSTHTDTQRRLDAIDFVEYFDIELLDGDSDAANLAELKRATWLKLVLCAHDLLFQKRTPRAMQQPVVFVSERSAFMHSFATIAEQEEQQQQRRMEVLHRINGHMYMKVPLGSVFIAIVESLLESSVANYKVVGNNYY